MLRTVPLALLATLLMLSPAWTEESDASKPSSPRIKQLKGAPAVVATPTGKTTEMTPAPGQWLMDWSHEDAGVLRFRAQVFPVKGNRDPGTVLVQALDTMARTSRFGGFGVPSRKQLDVFGRPAAEGSFQVGVNGNPTSGFARILLVNDHQWAFIYGLMFAPPAQRAKQMRILKRVVRSLEPLEPAFYTPAFLDADGLAATVYRAPGEPEITGAHLRAIATLIEAGLGRRFPVQTRQDIEEMLLEDVRRGSPATRAGYRSSAMDLQRSMTLEPKASAERVAALGTRIVEAVLARRKQGYLPAVGAAKLWTADAEPAVGTGDDAWQAGTLAVEAELARFFVSLARDEDTPPPPDLAARRTVELQGVWEALGTKARGERRSVRADWAGLRRAWDQAKPQARRAFRRAVVHALTPTDRQAAMPPATDGRGLRDWCLGLRAPAQMDGLFARALALPAAERTRLIALLGSTSAGIRFPW